MGSAKEGGAALTPGNSTTILGYALTCSQWHRSRALTCGYVGVQATPGDTVKHRENLGSFE